MFTCRGLGSCNAKYDQGPVLLPITESLRTGRRTRQSRLVTEKLSVQPKVAKDLMHLRGSREDTIASAHQDPLMCALKMPRKIPVNPLLDLKEQISYRPRRTLAILRPNNAGPQGAVSESQRIGNRYSDQQCRLSAC